MNRHGSLTPAAESFYVVTLWKWIVSQIEILSAENQLLQIRCFMLLKSFANFLNGRFLSSGLIGLFTLFIWRYLKQYHIYQSWFWLWRHFQWSKQYYWLMDSDQVNWILCYGEIELLNSVVHNSKRYFFFISYSVGLFCQYFIQWISSKKKSIRLLWEGKRGIFYFSRW